MSFKKHISILLMTLLLTFLCIATTFGSILTKDSSNNSKIYASNVHIFKTGFVAPTQQRLANINKKLIKPRLIRKNLISEMRLINRSYTSKNSQKYIDSNCYMSSVATFGKEVEGNILQGSSAKETTSPSFPRIQVKTTQVADDSNLPDKVDNTTDPSTAPYFPAIGDQGFENSCSCFSTTYYVLTYMTALARGVAVKNDPSKIFSPAWTYNLINGGYDDGSWIVDAYDIMKHFGCATLSKFSYIEPNAIDANNEIAYRKWATDPNIWEDALTYKINSEGVITDLNKDKGQTQLKQMLSNGYIMVFATNADYLPECSYENYTVISSPNPSAPSDDVSAKNGGIHVCSYSQGSTSNHAMTVVGYDDNIKIIDKNGKTSYGAFKTANSWGKDWADNGFVWFSYSALKNSAWYDNSAWYITAMSQPYTPQLLGKFTINTTNRSKIYIGIGYSNTESSISQNIWVPPVLDLNGGPFAFDGSPSHSCTGGFALDYTPNANLGNTKLLKYAYISINGIFDISHNTVLKSFYLKDSKNNIYKSTVNLPITMNSSNKISSWAGS